MALKLWPSCSIQGLLLFLRRNALEGSVCFPMILAGQGLRPRKLLRCTSSSSVRSKDSLCEKTLVRGGYAKSNPLWLWIVLAQGSCVPGMWEYHWLQMQWEELGAVLVFNPDDYRGWSDEIYVKGFRTYFDLPFSLKKKKKIANLCPVLPVKRNWWWCSFSSHDHLHSWPSS